MKKSNPKKSTKTEPVKLKLKPVNRKTEVLAVFMHNPTRDMSYVDISYRLRQNNTHKYVQWLEDSGIKFKETVHTFTNRFGRTSFYKTFKLKSLKQALKLWPILNK